VQFTATPVRMAEVDKESPDAPKSSLQGVLGRDTQLGSRASLCYLSCEASRGLGQFAVSLR
jgi:hypothetical protein